MKTPSTLTMRWLLHALEKLQLTTPGFTIQLASVWMDLDSVGFYAKPYDCAILLGDGSFGSDIEACKLFDEWLIPISAPDGSSIAPRSISRFETAELIHPSPDRRDWRRRLAAMSLTETVSLARGKIFDKLDQAISAAMINHGVSIGDLHLIADNIRNGQISLPFKTAIPSGDAYYLVWQRESRRKGKILELLDFFTGDLREISLAAVELLGKKNLETS